MPGKNTPRLKLQPSSCSFVIIRGGSKEALVVVAVVAAAAVAAADQQMIPDPVHSRILTCLRPCTSRKQREGVTKPFLPVPFCVAY